jgi:hypothetical protein
VFAGAGLLVLGTSGRWGFGLLGAALLGAGDGLVIAAVHGIMATTSEDVPHGMNRLSSAVGAVAGPLWSGGALERWRSRRLRGLAAAVAALTRPSAPRGLI